MTIEDAIKCALSHCDPVMAAHITDQCRRLGYNYRQIESLVVETAYLFVPDLHDPKAFWAELLYEADYDAGGIV